MKYLLLLGIFSLLTSATAQAAIKCTSTETRFVKLLFYYQNHLWIQKSPNEKPRGISQNLFVKNINTKDSYLFSKGEDGIIIDFFTSRSPGGNLEGQIRWGDSRLPIEFKCEREPSPTPESFRSFFGL